MNKKAIESFLKEHTISFREYEIARHQFILHCLVGGDGRESPSLKDIERVEEVHTLFFNAMMFQKGYLPEPNEALEIDL